MALTLTYDRNKKTAVIKGGAIGLGSVETVAAQAKDGTALAAGTVCLRRSDTGTAIATWTVASGSFEADTRTSGLAALFDAQPVLAQAEVIVTVKDASGNLLGAGTVCVANSRDDESEGETSASGGPLAAEAGEALAAGCPVKIADGKAYACPASDHALFAGISDAAAALGDAVGVIRFGAAHVAEWGLTAGALYWLPQSGQTLSDAPAGIALCVGVAQDADTLILTGGRLCVQPRAEGSAAAGYYLAWDSDGKRLVESAAAAAGGEAAANQIPKLDGGGKLPASMIPTASVQTPIDAAVATHNGSATAHADLRAAINNALEAANAKQSPPSAEALAAVSALSASTGSFTENQLRDLLNAVIAALKGIYS